MSSSCECHHIDWMSPLNNGGYTCYRYTNGVRHEQCVPHPTFGLPCGDKVNLDIMEPNVRDIICKYIIPDQSLFPEEVYWFLKYGSDGLKYNRDFDENSPYHYLKHYSSVKEMFRIQGYDVDSPHLQRSPAIEEGIPPISNTSTEQST